MSLNESTNSRSRQRYQACQANQYVKDQPRQRGDFFSFAAGTGCERKPPAAAAATVTAIHTHVHSEGAPLLPAMTCAPAETVTNDTAIRARMGR